MLTTGQNQCALHIKASSPKGTECEMKSKQILFEIFLIGNKKFMKLSIEYAEFKVTEHYLIFYRIIIAKSRCEWKISNIYISNVSITIAI